ncbi:MAG: hypothetical protein K0R15_518 [Clostridiales bacterium]|jgi:DNA repair protein RadC|nr:hypothetical protein [Clostridiales bacterium]
MGEKKLMMKELPISERPYEKCEKYGATSLSDAELLAVIIRTGSNSLRSTDLAERVLTLSENKRGLSILNYLTINELKKVRGVGKVKAIQLQCVAEIAKRMAKSNAPEKLCVSSPSSLAQHFMSEMRYLTREQLMLVLLDTKNKVIFSKTISMGTVNSSLVSPRELFIEALKNDAVSVAVLHNHPSGDPTPSKEDIAITKRIMEAGSIIGIQLLDHIIIGDGNYVSLKERGLI